MSDSNPANMDRLRYARDLLDALERDDAEAELEAINGILAFHDQRLHGDLTRIAGELRDALSASQYSGELSRLAKNELPDAQQRLNRVIELTESAADTSLTAVETALPLIKGIRTAVADAENPDSGASSPGDRPADDKTATLLNRIADDSVEIEKCLSEVLLAQGFQDITGQIIRRVVKLVAELEEYLSSAGLPIEYSSERKEESLHRGNGPAVQGIDDDAIQHQQDVDDLLGQLGL